MVRVDVVKKTSGKGGNKWWWWTWTARWATAATSKPTSMSRATWTATTTWRFNCPTLTWTKSGLTIVSAPWRWYLMNENKNNSFSTCSQWGQKNWELRTCPATLVTMGVRWIGSGNLPGVEDKKTRGGFVRGFVFVLYGKILPFKIPHSSS
jgi:hypothetical protein